MSRSRDGSTEVEHVPPTFGSNQLHGPSRCLEIHQVQGCSRASSQQQFVQLAVRDRFQAARLTLISGVLAAEVSGQSFSQPARQTRRLRRVKNFVPDGELEQTSGFQCPEPLSANSLILGRGRHKCGFTGRTGKGVRARKRLEPDRFDLEPYLGQIYLSFLEGFENGCELSFVSGILKPYRQQVRLELEWLGLERCCKSDGCDQ